MRSRIYALGALIFVGMGPIATSGQEKTLRPNVVLIVADDLGWADLGCYGSQFHKTPNLDRLAAEGRRFVQAYSASPVCSPTRAALMTGKHPARLHITDWIPGLRDRPSKKLLRPRFRQELPLEEKTIAESLKEAGYTTALLGKWHLGGEGFGPREQGFDVNIGGSDIGTTLSYIAPFSRSGKVMTGLESAPDGQYLTDRLTDEAEKFLDANKARPFFLYMPHYAVHTPMVAKANLIGHYPEWNGTPHGRQENPVYAAMLESLDESVGRVIAKLDSLGLTERTLLIFTSDNGGFATGLGPNLPATINSPLRDGKSFLYEGGLRVPLIVRWPGRLKPGVDKDPVWSGDLAPTIKEFCDIKDRILSDGVSLAALLDHGIPLAPRSLYWHYPHENNQGDRFGGAIRNGDWKLVEDFESGRKELFNLAKDFKESANLSEKHPDKVKELAAELDAWRTSIAAQMPLPNPEYKPNPQDKDGAVTLPARSADVHGVMLRFEPLPHKNTLGYWVRTEDWASWEFDLKEPGEFRVQALIGCGKGSGGATVEFRIDKQILKLKVAETGGFQQFLKQDLGRLTLDNPGRLVLEVHATSKPGPAVMDLREIKLIPVGR